ncbi:glycine zipper 2TM domain-containing protein [Steroidobacter sp.]|uniref:glycine zipper 2TM domain-containing protein n=1 Tax=Steroidobacter sp. TaxID=1978227 RepID=UPI001A4EF19C|nr:glycine zipper 2TM domain-containing protein [Steroidobacter sp.]MBL8268541.1 glycine zipper 2TM domain-containing protein [Steroidobacter sp.]
MKSQHFGMYVATCVMAVALTGCAREEAAPSSANASASASDQSAVEKAAELEAREQELAQREAEVAAKEAEQETLRRAEAEAAEREASKVAAAKKAADEAAAKRAAAKKAAEARAAAGAAVAQSTSPPAVTAPAPTPVEVRAGTQLVVALASDMTTKTAKVGDRFEARLATALHSDDRLVAPEGSRVTGTITEVVSGSSQIGAVPALGLRFDQLELADGRQMAIRGELQQLGTSEKGADAAKIIGGAAAGAVIGHQIKHGNKGKVIGGILGGAAGAMVAKNTGSEVQLQAGSQLTIVLEQGFVVTAR